MQVDHKDPNSKWNAHPSNHRLRPGGSEYGTRYAFVKKHVRAGAKVLDLGCNCGQLAMNLTRELGCQVVGVDIVGEFVDYCLANAPGAFYQGNVSDLTAMLPVIRDGPFDVVTALEVIEHPVDVEGLVDVLTFALQPNGVFIITTPAPKGVYGPKYMATHPHHVRLWDAAGLEDAFGKALAFEDIYTVDDELAHIGAVFAHPNPNAFTTSDLYTTPPEAQQ